jgi:hypothetical protein
VQGFVIFCVRVCVLLTVGLVVRSAHDVQQDPAMLQMMQGMQNPEYRQNIEARLAQLKQDPELASVMEEIEKGGPAAMMKCVPCPRNGVTSYTGSVGRHGAMV